MKFVTFQRWALAASLTLTLAACSGGGNHGTDTLGEDWTLTEGGTEKVFATFNLGGMPLPNDVVWRMYDTDPGVEFPASANDSELMVALKAAIADMGDAEENPLLGLSNNMFLTIPVTGAVNAENLDVLVFNTTDTHFLLMMAALQTLPPDIPTAVGHFMAMERYTVDDFLVVNDGGVIKLLPKKPFTPGGYYAVVVKNTIEDANGYPVESDLGMTMLKSTTAIPASSPFYKLEAVRAGFNDGPTALFNVVQGVTTVMDAADGSLDGTAWSRDDVLVMWTFHTADRTLNLTATGDTEYPTDEGNAFTDMTAAFKGLSEVFISNAPDLVNTWDAGTIATVFGSIGAPYAALDAIHFGTYVSPKLSYGTDGATDTVTFLLAVPAGEGPFPVILFQHGLTSKKEDVFGIVNSYAAAGFAVMAIDAPLHGGRTVGGGSSGDGYFSANLLANRANLYQSAVDLWEAVDILEDGTLEDALSVSLENSGTGFSTLSLGSIIGSVFLNQETRIQKMHLAAPSAMLANVLDESSMPSLTSLVGSLGYTKGTTSYYVFLNLTQWLLDPIDPAYMGIGENSTDNLMTVMAYGDPIVSTDSARLFLTNLDFDIGGIVPVTPDGPGTDFPTLGDCVAGAYEFGNADYPVVHTWLLSPSRGNPVPSYYTDYDATFQQLATYDVQQQAATFFALSVPE